MSTTTSTAPTPAAPWLTAHQRLAALVACGSLEVFLIGGITFGWSSFIVIFQDEYLEKCDDGETSCNSQTLAFSLAYTVASTVLTIMYFVWGVVLDRFGVSICHAASAALIWVGIVLLIFFDSRRFDSLIPAMAFISGGGPGVYSSLLNVSEISKKYGGTMVACVSAAYDASALMGVLLATIADATSRTGVFVGFAILAFLVAVNSFVMWTPARLQALQTELAQEEEAAAARIAAAAQPGSNPKCDAPALTSEEEAAEAAEPTPPDLLLEMTNVLPPTISGSSSPSPSPSPSPMSAAGDTIHERPASCSVPTSPAVVEEEEPEASRGEQLPVQAPASATVVVFHVDPSAAGSNEPSSWAIVEAPAAVSKTTTPADSTAITVITSPSLSPAAGELTFLAILRCWRFWLCVFVTSIFYLRVAFYYGTVTLQLESYGGVTKGQADEYTLIFTILVSVASIAAPLIGLVQARWGIASAFTLAQSLLVVFSVTILIPVLGLQVVSFLAIGLARTFTYPTIFYYLVVLYGFRHIGKAYGLTVVVAGGVSAIQYPLTESALHGSGFQPINVGLLVASCATLLAIAPMWTQTKLRATKNEADK